MLHRGQNQAALHIGGRGRIDGTVSRLAGIAINMVERNHVAGDLGRILVGAVVGVGAEDLDLVTRNPVEQTIVNIVFRLSINGEAFHGGIEASHHLVVFLARGKYCKCHNRHYSE